MIHLFVDYFYFCFYRLAAAAHCRHISTRTMICMNSHGFKSRSSFSHAGYRGYIAVAPREKKMCVCQEKKRTTKKMYIRFFVFSNFFFFAWKRKEKILFIHGKISFLLLLLFVSIEMNQMNEIRNIKDYLDFLHSNWQMIKWKHRQMIWIYI